MPQVRVFRVTHADLTEASNGIAQVVKLLDLPARAKVLGATVEVETQFSGGGFSTLTVDLGTGTDADLFIADYDAAGAPSNTNFADYAGWKSTSKASEALNLRFEIDASHNLAALTAGSVLVSVCLVAVGVG